MNNIDAFTRRQGDGWTRCVFFPKKWTSRWPFYQSQLQPEGPTPRSGPRRQSAIAIYQRPAGHGFDRGRPRWQFYKGKLQWPTLSTTLAPMACRDIHGLIVAMCCSHKLLKFAPYMKETSLVYFGLYRLVLPFCCLGSRLV